MAVYYKHALIVLAVTVVLLSCTTAPKPEGSGGSKNRNELFINAVRERNTSEITSMLAKGFVDVDDCKEDGVPAILLAIKLGLSLEPLETMLRMSALPPSVIMDFNGRNAYEYVKSYRNNNDSYLKILEKYQGLKE